MKVSELIEWLSKCKLDDEVVVSFPAFDYRCHKIHEVESWVEIKEGICAVSINAEFEEIEYDSQ